MALSQSSSNSSPGADDVLPLVDPRTRFAQPPYPDQQKDTMPGAEKNLSPLADHGETTYQGHGRLRGRTALITGADSGIGRAVALCYAKEGADILFTCLPEEKEDADETIRLVTEVGRTAIAIPGDIRSSDFCRSLVKQTISSFGKIDILVNNAAFELTHDNFADISEEEFEKTFRTNVFGAFYLAQAALPAMKPGGVIINTCSGQAYTPEKQLSTYAATKATLVSLTKTWSQYAMEFGVRVNGVAPGPVWTPLIPSAMKLNEVRDYGAAVPLTRTAQPVEQAAIFVFLASDDASYVTGEIYGATGGITPY